MNREGRRAWLVVFLMWVAYVLNYMDRQLVFSLFPVLRAELGLTDSELGWTGSIFLWVYALTSPVAGLLGDRFSKQWLVVGSLGLWSAAMAVMGMARSPGHVLACRAVIGVVEGFFMPSAIALTAGALPPGLRSRAIGVLSTAQLAGVFLGGFFGGWMGDAHLWRWAFYALGLAGMLYAFPLHRLLQGISPPPTAAPSTRLSAGGTLAALFRVPSYGVLCLVFPAFCFALWLMYSWLPDYFYQKFGLTLSEAGTAATAFTQGPALVGLLIGGASADCLYPRLRASRFYLLLVGLVLLAPCLHLLGRTDSLRVAEASAAGFGFGSGLFVANLMVSSFDVIPRQVQASAVGTLNLLGGLVSGWAAYLGGAYCRKPGIPTLMSAAAALCAGGAIILAIVIGAFFRRDHDRAAGSNGEPAPQEALGSTGSEGG
ncbi:MAG TPA: MFS transporter [Planctomycetota bacterium]|nr:MFS transporter [Planctomycetota bacterium]